jgi:hypothetical protein
MALWLTACGDDGGHHEDLAHALCADAAAHCDAGHDGAVIEDDGSEPPDEEPPREAGGDHDAGPSEGADTGAAESDAAVPSDGDAQVMSGDGGANAHVDDAAVTSGSDAATDSDAGTIADAGPIDSGTNSDAGTSADAGNTDAGGGSTFVPVRFSATDHGASAYLSADRLSVENRGEPLGNARSDSAIAPGAGVFYFEAHREIDTAGFYGIGIATATASLTSDLGSDAKSLGLFTHGDFTDTGSTCSAPNGFDSAIRDYGLVIDYRAANPRVLYVFDDGAGGAEIRHICTTAITDPVYIMYSGARWEVGYQISINTGADTVNHPFYYSAAKVKAALAAAGEQQVSNAIVFGFGRTRALPLSAKPVLSAPADRSVPAGSNVVLTGTATDAEDGSLTANIQWIDISSQHHDPVVGTGESFSFVAKLGRHPVIMQVTDSVGVTVEHTVMVTATGSVPTQSSVRLVGAPDDPLASGPPESIISSDGLSVDLRATAKKGVRCNQAIYGQYWYFEAHRNGGPANEGVGLVIPEGNLNPYDFVNVPWSMSINLSGSTWYNLNSVADWTSSNASNHYGFAVDYRGEHPRVHIIIGGTFHRTVEMKDVWGPLHPMVYGNPGYSPEADPGDDITVNFGRDSSKPFVFDPQAILGTLADGIQMRWGN